MFVEYEPLNERKEDVSELLFESMKKRYKGEEVPGPEWRNIDDLMLYRINNNEVRVSRVPIYRERKSSVIISNDNKNEEQIFNVKSKLERESKEEIGKFKLKLIRKSKG